MQVAAAEALGKASRGEDGGAAGAQPNHHARRYEIRGIFASLLFKFLDVQVGLLGGHYRVLERENHHRCNSLNRSQSHSGFGSCDWCFGCFGMCADALVCGIRYSLRVN